MTKSTGKIIRDPEERFWAFVELPNNLDDCWEWVGRKSHKGYGGMKINSKHTQAHRFSYRIHFGSIQEGKLVCHKCDNPSCVNPSHLFLGTIQENNLDRDRKERKALGEQNGKSKLTVQDVRRILKLFEYGYTPAEISRMYNRPHSTIYAIKVGRSWSWL